MLKLDNVEITWKPRSQHLFEKRVQRSLSLVKEGIFLFQSSYVAEDPPLVSMGRKQKSQALA